VALVVLAVALGLAAAPVPQAGQDAAAPLPAHPDPEGAAWVQRTFEGLSTKEKVAQLVVVGLRGELTSTDSDEFERLLGLARDWGVGGFHVFGGLEPVPDLLLNPSYGKGGRRGRSADALGTAALLNRLQNAARVPLLVSADFEGGAGYIVAGATRLPRAMALGATGDTSLAFRAGELTAREGRALGVHVCFFPVVDVNNNPKNPIINMRSFGESPSLVADMSTSAIRGLHAGGMLATAKHWPGHGDTDIDTHLDMAVLRHSRAHLDRVELVPFRAAIEAGVDAVMTSHIHLTALDPRSPIPATMSRNAIVGLLREELGFDGLVFTDSMSMQAITRRYRPGQAAARAIAAGSDVILDPPDPEAALRGLEEAVANGTLSQERVDLAVGRILRAKARLGLHALRTTSLMDVPTRVGGRAGQVVADEIAARAVTLLKDERHSVPLPVSRRTRVLYLSVIDSVRGWREGVPSRTFLPGLREHFAAVDAAEISPDITDEQLAEVRRLARQCRAVVASTFVRVAGPSESIALAENQIELLEELAKDRRRPLVTVVFGNPYSAIGLAPRLPAVLLTYEYTDVAERAALRAVLGEAPITGKLPVSFPGLFPAGHGLERPGPQGAGDQAAGAGTGS